MMSFFVINYVAALMDISKVWSILVERRQKHVSVSIGYIVLEWELDQHHLGAGRIESPQEKTRHPRFNQKKYTYDYLLIYYLSPLEKSPKRPNGLTRRVFNSELQFRSADERGKRASADRETFLATSVRLNLYDRAFSV